MHQDRVGRILLTVPVNLNCGIAIHENEMARGELLISHVCTENQINRLAFLLSSLLAGTYPKLPPTKVKSARNPPEPFSM
jgi:hypothetical protein